jgi:hypothetical protein
MTKKYPIPEGMPQQYLSLVNTTVRYGGWLFSKRKVVPIADYECLAIRWGTSVAVNIHEANGISGSYENPTYELLLKSDSMRARRWSQPFVVKEIILNQKHLKTA